MPSEDSLAEPVPTSHFTGQQGQGPSLGQGWDLPLTPCSLYFFLSPQQVPGPIASWCQASVGTGAAQE